MYKVSVIANFDIDLNFETEEKCELYLDCTPQTEKNCKRILWVLESNDVSKFRNEVINNHNKFDLILTFDDEILTTCKNSKLFPYGTTWVKNYDLNEPKKFCVTTLVGGKTFFIGHQMRHSLIKKLDLIKSIQVDVFNSINFPFDTIQNFKQISDQSTKNELFYSQFHIAIENSSSKNYFTEKIIDCFQTKTIPIYFGCSNLEDYFDIRGVFRVSSVEDIVEVCNSLNENSYHEKMEYVEKNYQTSFLYSDYKLRVQSEIISFLNQEKMITQNTKTGSN